ncbi:hypothetical protein CAMGR0001_0765 [Campylobacter gracilis RM3268]|uniref:Uncharacterized protein n=1 Tax=Campylobacter gracilis RM3268 TaxID=553220 RepID=C8PFX2_9BACT|nr:hypothetical protein CAMGR0001_0765 [Campylobacter gracilis RM3268]
MKSAQVRFKIFKFQRAFCALQILNNFCGRFSFRDRNFTPAVHKI